jgi:hypothetical protein
MDTFTGTLRDGDQVVVPSVQGHYRFEKKETTGQYKGYFVIPRAEAMKLATPGRSYCLAIEQGPTLDIDIEVSELAFHSKSLQAGFVSHGPSRSP